MGADARLHPAAPAAAAVALARMVEPLDVVALYRRYGDLVYGRCRTLLRDEIEEPARVDLAEAGTRVKGLDDGIEAWVMSGASPRPIYAGEKVRPGSRVQLRFRPRGHRWVTLAGKDGLGQVEIYGTVPGEDVAIATAPFSLTLDDTPGPQRFYAIVADRKHEASEVLRSLGVEPVAVAGAEVSMVEIAKE